MGSKFLTINNMIIAQLKITEKFISKAYCFHQKIKTSKQKEHKENLKGKAHV